MWTSTSPGSPSAPTSAGRPPRRAAITASPAHAPWPRRPHARCDLPVGVALGEVLALVVGPLAARQRELALHLAVGEVQRRAARASARPPGSCRSAARSRSRCSSSLRVRRGSWLVQLPCVYSGMCTLRSHTSPSSIGGEPRRRATPGRAAGSSPRCRSARRPPRRCRGSRSRDVPCGSARSACGPSPSTATSLRRTPTGGRTGAR